MVFRDVKVAVPMFFIAFVEAMNGTISKGRLEERESGDIWVRFPKNICLPSSIG